MVRGIQRVVRGGQRVSVLQVGGTDRRAVNGSVPRARRGAQGLQRVPVEGAELLLIEVADVELQGIVLSTFLSALFTVHGRHGLLRPCARPPLAANGFPCPRFVQGGLDLFGVLL